MGTEGHCKLESYDFGAERKRLKSPGRGLFNRAERVIKVKRASASLRGSACSPHILARAVGIENCLLTGGKWASAALYIQLIPGTDAEDCIKYKT